MNNAFAKAAKMSAAAAVTAVGKVRNMAGQTNDNQLILYNQLTPEVFSAIFEKYGSDAAMRYIDSMERKRLKEAQGI
jgi:hypothetical protein